MPYFSRLTDIVTCNLTEILSAAVDPAVTLREVIAEMHEGLAACRRSVKTSQENHDRLSREIALHREQAAGWVADARMALASGDEARARDCLTRKVELESLIAGLQPELEAANSTCRHMLRIQKALEARSADAARRLAGLSGSSAAVTPEPETAVPAASADEWDLRSEVDAELEALRRQLGS